MAQAFRQTAAQAVDGNGAAAVWVSHHGSGPEAAEGRHGLATRLDLKLNDDTDGL